VEDPLGSARDRYSPHIADEGVNAWPSKVTKGAKVIVENASILPTMNDEYPRLTVDDTAQYTFFDRAPFLRMTEESS
jgi:hypothetical protein